MQKKYALKPIFMKSIGSIVLIIFCMTGLYAQDPISYNPNNSGASVSIGWNNDISRIRYGGTGTGATNGFQIQGPSNSVKFTVLDNSFVGIGTSSPQDQLHVFRKSLSNGQVHDILRIQANTNGSRTTGFGARINFSLNKYDNIASGTSSTLGAISVYDANNESSFGTMAFATKERYDKSLENKMWLDRHGNLGIGTDSPSNKLEVYRSSGNEIVAQFRTDEGVINISAAGTTTENPDYGNYISSRNATNTAYEDFGLKTASGIPQFLVKTNGSVGIGTNNTGTYKLAVNGSIRSKEVKVEANWSDFVFYDNYDLRTLDEVEQHIKENGHLPDIPSEEEVNKNGISLGEMNAKLLQKIEELTLYLIEQNKENQKQQKLIGELQKEVSALRKD